MVNTSGNTELWICYIVVHRDRSISRLDGYSNGTTKIMRGSMSAMDTTILDWRLWRVFASGSEMKFSSYANWREIRPCACFRDHRKCWEQPFTAVPAVCRYCYSTMTDLRSIHRLGVIVEAMELLMLERRISMARVTRMNSFGWLEYWILALKWNRAVVLLQMCLFLYCRSKIHRTMLGRIDCSSSNSRWAATKIFLWFSWFLI